MNITEKSCLLKGTIISLVYHSVCLSPPPLPLLLFPGGGLAVMTKLLNCYHRIKVVFSFFCFGFWQTYTRFSFLRNLKESSGSGNVGGR